MDLIADDYRIKTLATMKKCYHLFYLMLKRHIKIKKIANIIVVFLKTIVKFALIVRGYHYTIHE